VKGTVLGHKRLVDDSSCALQGGRNC
jgi:hypothetical protein